MSTKGRIHPQIALTVLCTLAAQLASCQKPVEVQVSPDTTGGNQKSPTVSPTRKPPVVDTPDTDPTPLPPKLDGIPEEAHFKLIDLKERDPVDFVFTVDQSDDMGSDVLGISANYPNFVDGLAARSDMRFASISNGSDVFYSMETGEKQTYNDGTPKPFGIPLFDSRQAPARQQVNLGTYVLNPRRDDSSVIGSPNTYNQFPITVKEHNALAYIAAATCPAETTSEPLGSAAVTFNFDYKLDGKPKGIFNSILLNGYWAGVFGIDGRGAKVDPSGDGPAANSGVDKYQICGIRRVPVAPDGDTSNVKRPFDRVMGVPYQPTLSEFKSFMDRGGGFESCYRRTGSYNNPSRACQALRELKKSWTDRSSKVEMCADGANIDETGNCTKLKDDAGQQVLVETGDKGDPSDWTDWKLNSSQAPVKCTSGLPYPPLFNKASNSIECAPSLTGNYDYHLPRYSLVRATQFERERAPQWTSGNGSFVHHYIQDPNSVLGVRGQLSKWYRPGARRVFIVVTGDDALGFGANQFFISMSGVFKRMESDVSKYKPRWYSTTLNSPQYVGELYVFGALQDQSSCADRNPLADDMTRPANRIVRKGFSPSEYQVLQRYLDHGIVYSKCPIYANEADKATDQTKVRAKNIWEKRLKMLTRDMLWQSLPLKKADETPVYNVTGIRKVSIGQTVLKQGVDYELSSNSILIDPAVYLKTKEDCRDDPKSDSCSTQLIVEYNYIDSTNTK